MTGVIWNFIKHREGSTTKIQRDRESSYNQDQKLIILKSYHRLVDGGDRTWEALMDEEDHCRPLGQAVSSSSGFHRVITLAGREVFHRGERERLARLGVDGSG